MIGFDHGDDALKTKGTEGLSNNGSCGLGG